MVKIKVPGKEVQRQDEIDKRKWILWRELVEKAHNHIARPMWSYEYHKNRDYAPNRA